MAKVTVPASVSRRIVRWHVELWAPGQVVHRSRAGALSTPLLRASPRWRGQIELGAHPAVGPDAKALAVAEMDLFMARMSRPDNWCEMPFGGAPPRYRVPPGAYVAAVTVAETVAAGFSVRRSSAAGTGPLRVADWICALGRCAMVDAAGMVVGAVQSGVRTLPSLPLVVGTEVRPAGAMRIRFTPSGDSTIGSSRGLSYAGPWVLPWEEYVVAP